MIKSSKAYFIPLAAVLLCFLYSNAQATSTIQVVHVGKAPVLEDFLNGTSQEPGVQVTDFRQYNPHDGKPASQETSAYLSYDDKNLYVIFVCNDNRDKIRARMANRDNTFSDDVVGIFLDTFHDKQRAYSFYVNPMGIQTDIFVTEGQRPNLNFDTLWHSKGRLTSNGYIVWVAIPFKSLRFPKASVQTWGIALHRRVVRKNEFSYWPHISPRVRGFVPQMATLKGLENISPSRNMQFIPYSTLTHGRILDTTSVGAPALRSETEPRAGLDAKFIIHDAFTLDVAVNPDFSQVESDEPQVTVNQRFEVFFPEKRPFFLENANFFQTPETLFFSRRIADPQLGVRLTGKVGRWALGGLLMNDRAAGEVVPEADPLHGQRANLGVIRVQREFRKQSSLGFLLTNRDFASSSNRVFSVDTRLNLDPNWTFTGQITESRTRLLNGTKLTGPAYLAELSHTGKHANYVARYTDRSPNFRSELGFISRVDIRQAEQLFDYRWRPVKRQIVSFGPSASILTNWNRQGRMQDWIVNTSFGVDIVRQTALALSYSESFELFQNRGFRKNNLGASFSTEWLKWLGVSASHRSGTNINFFPAQGLIPFLGNSTESRLSLTLRPAPQIRFDQVYVHTRLGSRNSSTPSITPLSDNSVSIFNNHIMRSKLNYQFTRELSVRAIFDYNAVLPNTSLVNLLKTKKLTADLLVTCLLNPGTAFYIGYTDRYENLVINPVGLSALDRSGAPTTSTGRQFFTKFSYLIR